MFIVLNLKSLFSAFHHVCCRFIKLIFFYPSSLRVFNVNGCWILSNTLQIFSFNFLLWRVTLIGMKPILYSCDKPNLFVLCITFCTLLHLVFQYIFRTSSLLFMIENNVYFFFFRCPCWVLALRLYSSNE